MPNLWGVVDAANKKRKENNIYTLPVYDRTKDVFVDTE